MTTARDVCNAVKSNPPVLGVDVNINNEEYFIDKNLEFDYEKSGEDVHTIHLRQAPLPSSSPVEKRIKLPPSPPLATVKIANVIEFLNLIEDGHFPYYRDVKEYTPWQTYYGIKLRNLPKATANFSDTVLKSKLSGACRRCRYIFPFKNLTVDHQKPQKGSGFMPLIKVFRGMGLTVGAPKLGGKNRSVYTKYGKKISGLDNVDAAPSGDASKYT